MTWVTSWAWAPITLMAKCRLALVSLQDHDFSGRPAPQSGAVGPQDPRVPEAAQVALEAAAQAYDQWDDLLQAHVNDQCEVVAFEEAGEEWTALISRREATYLFHAHHTCYTVCQLLEAALPNGIRVWREG